MPKQNKEDREKNYFTIPVLPGRYNMRVEKGKIFALRPDEPIFEPLEPEKLSNKFKEDEHLVRSFKKPPVIPPIDPLRKEKGNKFTISSLLRRIFKCSK